MLKKPLLLLMLIVLVAATASCLFDPEEKPPTDDPPNNQKFENLSQQWHVLNNIELAYSKRRLDKYDQLLDNDFTFFLFSGDVGGDVPESWDRDTEVSANENLFSTEQPPAPLKRCLGIRMNIQWEDNEGKPNLAWIELTPPNSSETWYTTTVGTVLATCSRWDRDEMGAISTRPSMLRSIIASVTRPSAASPLHPAPSST